MICIIDERGIVQTGNFITYVVTEENWKVHLLTKSEYVGSIWAKDITGPGLYYLAGTYLDSGYEAWRKVARVLKDKGELISNPEV